MCKSHILFTQILGFYIEQLVLLSVFTLVFKNYICLLAAVHLSPKWYWNPQATRICNLTDYEKNFLLLKSFSNRTIIGQGWKYGSYGN